MEKIFFVKYWLIVIIWIFIYIVSDIVYKGLPGAAFYAKHATCSLLVVVPILAIMRSKVTIIVSCLNLVHIIVSLIVAILYTSGNYKQHFMYINYPVIIQSLNATEAVVLAAGAPWIGLYNRLSDLCIAIHYRIRFGSSRIRDNEGSETSHNYS